jgi:hypothetical protein
MYELVTILVVPSVIAALFEKHSLLVCLQNHQTYEEYIRDKKCISLFFANFVRNIFRLTDIQQITLEVSAETLEDLHVKYLVIIVRL